MPNDADAKSARANEVRGKEPAKFDEYLAYLCTALGRANRNSGLMDYCRGLMLPIGRKSVEPLAAHADPLRVRSKHQSLHHFVADSDWSDHGVLKRVREWVMPTLGLAHGCYWVADDFGHPKSGKHSVGVGHQYCGKLGKTAYCQVAVSLSVASERGSVPLDYRLYLPREWAEDATRRARAGVPETVAFATKSAISLAQIRAAADAGVMPGTVLADATYGEDAAWRDGITALGLPYLVGIPPATRLRAAGVAPSNEPTDARMLALSLSDAAWQVATWREGGNAPLSSCFARVRVRPAAGCRQATDLRPEEWLLIEWPEGEAEPLNYWLSTVPADATVEKLVAVAKMRWRIERDHRALKQEFGLSHYEGRNWRGFHHHATLCIATYGFLAAHRLTDAPTAQNITAPKTLSLPGDYVPRGRPARPAPRQRLDQGPAHGRFPPPGKATSSPSALRKSGDRC